METTPPALDQQPPWDVMNGACPTRQLVTRIGDKWTLLVLYALEGGTMRYTELRRAVDGVSQKMLTQTVRALERDGLVTRTVHPTIPPRVEYALTPLGRSLDGVVAMLREWAYASMGDVVAARADYDAATAAGSS